MTGRSGLFLLYTVAVLSGCGKEESPVTSAGTSGPPSLHPFLSVVVDSCCITTGNVFTPNGDGVNDILGIVARNVTDVNVLLKYPNGTVIYDGDLAGSSAPSVLPAPAPDEPPLKLTLSVTGTGTAGQPLAGTAIIHTVSAPTQQCFSNAVAPVTPDQFLSYTTFELVCEPVSQSNDLICIQ